LSEEVFNNAISKLDSQVEALKEEATQIKILVGPPDKKKKILEHILETAKQKERKGVYINLEDLIEEIDVSDQEVILIDEIDSLILNPPLRRLSLRMKLEKMFEDLGPGLGKMVVFGARTNEGLTNFRDRFRSLYSKAEILDLR